MLQELVLTCRTSSFRHVFPHCRWHRWEPCRLPSDYCRPWRRRLECNLRKSTMVWGNEAAQSTQIIPVSLHNTWWYYYKLTRCIPRLHTQHSSSLIRQRNFRFSIEQTNESMIIVSALHNRLSYFFHRQQSLWNSWAVTNFDWYHLLFHHDTSPSLFSP